MLHFWSYKLVIDFIGEVKLMKTKTQTATTKQ